MGSMTAAKEKLGLREALSAARGLVRIVALGVGALALVACDDPATPDYRYRLTVEVETPDGLKTGSSVIEVTQTMGRSAGTGFGEHVFRRVRGEAVTVRLPENRFLFALLRSESDASWAATVMQAMAPDVPGDGWPDYLDNMLLIEGEKELPRTWSARNESNGRSAYPMLVTFGDLDDPTSVAKIDPDDLAATFGEGVKLKRITAELTDDPVTTGIEERLGWLPNYYDKMLDGQRLNNSQELANNLSQGSFAKGTIQ